jgi:hypothetical protein
MGGPSVDPGDTSKLGWVRGETYFDTYRPAIPKPVGFSFSVFLVVLPLTNM